MKSYITLLKIFLQEHKTLVFLVMVTEMSGALSGLSAAEG